MRYKKQLNIRFKTSQAFRKFQTRVYDFMDKHKIKTKQEAYVTILNFGLSKKEQKNDDPTLIIINLLKEINERLQVIEPELRLLYWGMISAKMLPKDKMEAIDISKLPLPKSLKRILDE